MRIYIFNEKWQEQLRLEEFCRVCLFEMGETVSGVLSFDKPEELLKQIQPYGFRQVYFLEMSYKDKPDFGIKFAKYIRLLDPLANLVFYTSQMDLSFMEQCFKNHLLVLDYIDKNESDEELAMRIGDTFSDIIRRYEDSDLKDIFSFSTRRETIHILFKDILYVETSSNSHRVIVVTKEHRIEVTANLADVHKQEKRFIRSHRSYLINPRHVLHLNRRQLELKFTNGDVCPISRSNLPIVLKRVKKVV